MNLYRQKSQTVEAVQFDPDVQPWPDGVQSTLGHERHIIETPEGLAWIDAGDWIVYGASGKPHICKPAIFEATYEPVDALLDAPAYDKIYQNVMERINDDLRKKVGGTL
jgi:hypothetical protein